VKTVLLKKKKTAYLCGPFA